MEADQINLHVSYGTAKGRNSFAVGMAAAQEAVRDLKKYSLAAVLVFTSVCYGLEEMLRGIHEVVGTAPVLGATTAGEICNRPQQESVVVIALASPYLQVRVGVGQRVSQDWQQAVAQAVSTPELSPFFSLQDSAIWTELTIQGKSSFGLLFSPGNTKTADSSGFEILEELKRLSLGQVPFVGGSAADDWRMKANYVFSGRRAYPDSVLVAVFETQLRFGLAMAHGFHPTTLRATATSVSGHEVLELDGQPAAELYSRLQGTTREALAGKHLTLTTGRPVGMSIGYGDYIIVVASFFTAGGGVRFTQPIPEGAVLTIMDHDPDHMIAAGRDAFHKAMLRGHISAPALALVFPCALRSPLLGDRNHEVITDIRTLAPGLPVVGFYSFGEQGLTDDGVNRHANEEITILVLGQQLSYGAQVALENEQLRLKLEQHTADLKTVNEKLLDEIGERQQAEETLSRKHRELQETSQRLEQSKNMLQLIIESIPVRVFWKDRDLRYLGCNTLFARDAGFSQPEQVLGKDDFTMGWREQADLYRADDRYVMESHLPKINIIEPQTTPTGAIIWLNTSKVPLQMTKDEVFGVLGVYEDITERKLTEEALRASLAEKEVLLREIHHRVKNNLQIVISLLSMQSRVMKEPRVQEVLHDCQIRIRSMALVHETLYRSDNFGQIKLHKYLQSLGKTIMSSYSYGRTIKILYEIEPIQTNIETAIPCGLILTELLSNALKHAFSDNRTGEILLSVRKNAEDEIVLTIKDNGVGIPAEIDLYSVKSLGLKLVNGLVRSQLGGKYFLKRDSGTEFQIIFKELTYLPRT